jgi:hypothetical protein
MKSFSSFYPVGLLALLLLTLRLPAAAQAPAWQSARVVAAATAAATSNYSEVTAMVVDGAGNVYLAGKFRNTVVLGSTTLTSLGENDVFVAKFNPASNQFVWAQRAGGTGSDGASSRLAVSGTSLYVAGNFTSPTAGFGPTVLANANVNGTNDMFVAKLTDAGSFVWAQRAGGTDNDYAQALAVSGASVYVAGEFTSPTAGFGPTVLSTAGSADVYVAKLTDAGSMGSFVWAQRAGGTSSDAATALAVSGSSVYVAGAFYSPTAGFGPTVLPNANANANVNAGTADVYVAKLTDAGSFVWAQRAGGTGSDAACALAVSGTSVYVAGYFSGSAAGFGPIVLSIANANAGSAGVYVADVYVAKLTDAGSTGSFAWAQRAGGTHYDAAYALAVSGTSVYVAGAFHSPTAGFGPTVLSTAGLPDVYVAKLTDAGSTGSFVWAQRAGGTGSDAAYALAISGASVFVAGAFYSPTTNFGTISLTNPYPNPYKPLGFLASLTDPTLTATAPADLREPASLYPNPARQGATPLTPR